MEGNPVAAPLEKVRVKGGWKVALKGRRSRMEKKEAEKKGGGEQKSVHGANSSRRRGALATAGAKKKGPRGAPVLKE